MKQIETLLKREMGAKFDTRKTLNRAQDLDVPNEILQQIESGNMTFELLDCLKIVYPIFRYQTQITIHGNFDVKRKYIGGYKNLFLNGNNSLGVKYSAIDTAKIQKIRSMLSDSGIKDFRYMENSQMRVFRKSERISNENKAILIEKYTSLLKQISAVNIYGFCDCYILPSLFSGYEIYLDIHPLLIPINECESLVYSMLQCSQSEYFDLVLEATENRRIATLEAEFRQKNARLRMIGLMR